MALGGQSRGLIQASKTAGWDPTKLPAGNGQPEVDIGKFNVDPGNCNFGDMAGGPVPGGLPDPTRGMEDGFDTPALSARGKGDWSTHLQAEPTVRRGTKNANPTPGMPGA